MDDLHLPKMELTFEDDEVVEYGVMGVFELNNKNYIALVSPENEIIYYRYYEDEIDPILEIIDDETEDDLVRQQIDKLFFSDDE